MEQDVGIEGETNMKASLIKEIEKIAKENNTSFNNVIISMIEQCLEKK